MPEAGLEPARGFPPGDFKSPASAIPPPRHPRRRPDSNRGIAVLQTAALVHLATPPYKKL